MNRPSPTHRRRPRSPSRTARSSDTTSIFARQPRLILFSLAYLVIATAAVIAVRNTEFAFYLVSLLVIIAGVLALDRKIQFSPSVMWGLSAWGAMHLAGGLVPLPQGWPYHGEQAVLYSGWIIPEILKYDNLVHAFGFGVASIAALEAMKPRLHRYEAPSLGEAIAAALVGCGLGSVNEILEFIATRISPETNVGGYVNTSLDLVANLVGATIAMCLVSVTRRRQ